MPTTIDDVKRKAAPILKKARVKKSSLFGSLARGEFRKGSDIDILVEMPKGKSLFDFVDLKLQLEDALETKVDLVQYKTIKPLLRESILSAQVPLL